MSLYHTIPHHHQKKKEQLDREIAEFIAAGGEMKKEEGFSDVKKINPRDFVINSKSKREYGKKYRALGEEKTLAAWSEDKRCKVSKSTLNNRLKNGWEPEQAITVPADKERKRMRFNQRVQL